MQLRPVTHYTCFWVFASFLLLVKKLGFGVFAFSHHFAAKISKENDVNIKNDRNSCEGVGEGRGVGWWTEGGGKRE